MGINIDTLERKIYPSVKEAGLSTGLPAGHISKCALGKAVRAGRYYWKYI